MHSARMVQFGEIVGLALALVAFAFALGLLTGCQTQDAKSAAYETELTDCTLRSKTLCDSIRCENMVRVRYGRQARGLPSKCIIEPFLDAGVDQ